MWFLGHFNKSELDILDEFHLARKLYLQHEPQDMEQVAVMLDEHAFWESSEEILHG